MLKRLQLSWLLPATLIVIVAGYGGSSAAQENPVPPASDQVLSYNSDITVNPNSTLLVTETIKIFVVGGKSHQQFHRDILTTYHDRFSNPYDIHLEVLSLQRDSQPVGIHLRKITDGLRVDLGPRHEAATPGEHTYDLTYSVDRELGFYSEYDELYWNVTGDGWNLPIQQATATVHLPRGIVQQAILLDAYTGRAGSAATNYVASADALGTATFRTTGPLAPGESMTIVTRWPRGFVHPPTEEQQHQYFLEDYQADLIGLVGFIVILIYYGVAWFLAGRQSARGEIEPQPDPPRGFSPSAIRYLWRQAFDQKTMVVTLIDLAIKKQLAILEDGSGGYILGRLKPRPPGPGEASPPTITADERLVVQKLFAKEETVPLVPANHALVGGAMESLHFSLRTLVETVDFRATGRWLVPGWLLSLAIVIRCAYAIQGSEKPLVLWLALGLFPWSLASLAAAELAMTSWGYTLSDPLHAPTARQRTMVTSAICLPLLLGVAAGLGGLVWAASTGVAVLFAMVIALSYLFHLLTKSPGRAGSALVNQIDAVRTFLAAGEQVARDPRKALKITPAIFERLLPYAMALNVEKVWCEKFVAASAKSAKGGMQDYSPNWYSGPGWDPITAATFATSLGNSFSSAISISTRPRGSKPRRGKSAAEDGVGR